MRPSANCTPSNESFQHWLPRPCGDRVWYSTNPSPSASPYRSIHSSARTTCSRIPCTNSRSRVHRQYAFSMINHSCVASVLP
jgi:hypothetical protein